MRGRLRNRWQDEVREGGRIVGGEGWQEKVHSRVEWKKLLRTARNSQILHVPMEWVLIINTCSYDLVSVCLGIQCYIMNVNASHFINKVIVLMFII